MTRQRGEAETGWTMDLHPKQPQQTGAGRATHSPYIKTMEDPNTLTGMINNRLITITNADISRVLQVPETMDGLPSNALKKLTIEDVSSIFEGGMVAHEGNFWRIDKACEPWREWFVFINGMFTFESSPQALSYDMILMAVEAWRGARLDWARIIDFHLRRVLWEYPGTVPENKEVRTYLSMLCLDVVTPRLSTNFPVAAGGTSSVKPAPKRTRVPADVQAAEKPPRKRQQKVKPAPALDEVEREELETRLATEASKVTELEDRIRDLLAQSEHQAELLNQQQQKIDDLNTTIDRNNTVRQAMSNAAQRKDEMLTTARAQTAKIHEDQQTMIDQLRDEVNGVRQEKKNAVETIGRLHEHCRIMKQARSAVEDTRERRNYEETIDRLRTELLQAR